jgi:hypothetical protein
LPSGLGPGIVFQKYRQARLGLLVGGLQAGNGDVTSTLVKQASAGRPLRPWTSFEGAGFQDGSKGLARKVAIDRVTKKDTQASETIGARPFARGRVRVSAVEFSLRERRPLKWLKRTRRSAGSRSLAKENRSGEFRITATKTWLAPRYRRTSHAWSDRTLRWAQRPRPWRRRPRH